MTDYYYTEIVAYGNIADVRRLHDYLSPDNGGFSFDRFIPMPEYIYKGDLGPTERELYGANNWLDWSCENWGTKWDCDEVSVTLFEDGAAAHLSIVYRSPWRSSFPVSKVMSLRNPNLKFLMKSQDECTFGETIVNRLDAKNGFREAIDETAFPYEHNGRLDLNFGYRANADFLEEWSMNAQVQKAMTLLGYGSEERQAMATAA
ncbi:hypothetical protein MCEREM21A_00621 [Sphingomonadaceae bacterium]